VRIEDSRCLVVGGAHRLGYALALSLASSGAHVAVSSRSAAAADSARQEILRLGRRAAAVRGDVATRVDARHLVAQAASDLGGLDVVVFAASGPFTAREPATIGEDEWDASMDVIARGLLFVAQAAREQFLGQTTDTAQTTRASRPREEGTSRAPERGVVVAMTDVAAVQPWPLFAAHCAAKAAQTMVIRVLAKAWTQEGIRVCGVSPGPVDLADDDHRDASLRAASAIPSGSLVSPADVAAAVLLCIASSSMTGATVAVDGGALLR